MSDKIKVVKNFFSEEECAELIERFEQLYASKDPDLIQDTYEPKDRNALSFGRDRFPEIEWNQTLDPLKDHRPFFKTIFERVLDKAKEVFNDEAQLYLTQVFFSKQEIGGEVPAHDDTNEGVNTQFTYSAVGYLNSLNNSGHIIFDEMNFQHLPEAGDLVIFLSGETGTHKVLPVNAVRYTMPMWITRDPEWKLEL